MAFKIRQNPFSVGALPRTPLGELTTLPRLPSQLEKGHPSPYPTPFGTDPPSALAMRPPQNSSQIYAYGSNLLFPYWLLRGTYNNASCDDIVQLTMMFLSAASTTTPRPTTTTTTPSTTTREITLALRNNNLSDLLPVKLLGRPTLVVECCTLVVVQKRP